MIIKNKIYNSFTYYHRNALGSTVAITNSTGDVFERYEYDAYGKPTVFSSTYQPRAFSYIGNTYLFTGREYDYFTGLYYYRARHYSPIIGRFLQRDPIGLWEDEVNLGNGYSYVGNNPVNWGDALGLVSTESCDAVAMGAGLVDCMMHAYVLSVFSPIAGGIYYFGCAFIVYCNACVGSEVDAVCPDAIVLSTRANFNCVYPDLYNVIQKKPKRYTISYTNYVAHYSGSFVK